MKKKFNHYVSLSLLFLSVLPFSLVSAETVEEVPTGETTISSMADDPLKELKEKAENQVPTIESTPESKSVEDTPTSESETKEDVPKTEDTTETKPKPQVRGGGIGPQAVNLIEGNPNDPGVDIDAQFAQLLRTDKSTTNGGGAWSGYGKGANQLTDDDMANLTYITVNRKNLSSLKGIEYAVNILRLRCENNQLGELVLTGNTVMTELFCNNNRLTKLDITNCIALIKIKCDYNQLNELDVTKNIKLEELNCYYAQLSKLDVTKNIALTTLECGSNTLNDLDVTKNIALAYLTCEANQLGELDLRQNTALIRVYCAFNQLSKLELRQNIVLENLDCQRNQLSKLDVTQNTALEYLNCRENQLGELDITQNIALTTLRCEENQLSKLDVTQNTVLAELACGRNQLSKLDVTQNTALTNLSCFSNQLSDLDVTQNTALTNLSCSSNQLSDLDVTQNTALTNLDCSSNQLSDLDVTQNTALTNLSCPSNQLSDLDVTQNTALKGLNCSSNQLRELDVSQNIALTNLDCFSNQIADISNAYNLNNLTSISAQYQELRIPVPSVSASGEAVVDILKTTAGAGLSANNVDIIPVPGIAYNGDKILLSNVTKESLSEKKINFSYNGSQLVEGASSGTKNFGGSITFFSVSDLASELKPDRKKVKSGGKVEWTWTIASLTVKKAESIRATLDTLPSGVVIDPSSVKKDGSPTSINDLYGTNLGDLDYGESMVFTFETTITGNVDEWKELKGSLDWEDDTISSPHHNETKGRVQVHDDEQTYTPKDSDDMAIQSVPVYFNHGTNPIMSTAQTYHLHAMNYQSNTKVVTDGFYTRIKDDRAISTGWKLTAKLSDFKDSSNQPMPNGTGTMLKLENMSIERVTDRDTPQEVIDPTPSGLDVPSVQATETLVAGQSTAKTIVSAQPNEGQDTWQLRMPFDKVSLSIPANAGKKKTVYKANLTWSLDDTP
ncbi:WxL domain-containing protein [Enterococcus hulanensis]|uniref:WxL domain-containing protein n=1 Tax=Enterococcus hulanensis TaxID=2559929 RepID=A0ABU3EV21_9ENTE|nr:WxL domain-containing protein [Enterococcus hulanensis]MDT2598709.1 WxL domain-containing protein [Enterococcus hulanensis]MDT2607787.1 WxL domain-containing protein [Enterococcus hulanensis]MDT2615082.1 WxL domain-containing protein [Enterococcus hulanensis]MDT2626948.1 WxL domain-containing protein [Enterococcus hulanensis]MDT2654153.1 WxL domain-containing protein [Enterococcus hulanensis]